MRSKSIAVSGVGMFLASMVFLETSNSFAAKKDMPGILRCYGSFQTTVEPVEPPMPVPVPGTANLLLRISNKVSGTLTVEGDEYSSRTTKEKTDSSTYVTWFTPNQPVIDQQVLQQMNADFLKEAESKICVGMANWVNSGVLDGVFKPPVNKEGNWLICRNGRYEITDLLGNMTRLNCTKYTPGKRT